MTCGECGSGVTCMDKEKFVKMLGTTKIYRYYLCTRAQDRRCKNPYIREDNLIEQLSEIIDGIEIDRLGARHLIDKEVARFNKLRSQVLGVKEKEKALEMDVKRYAKYLLEEGTIEEKRQLLEQLRGKITLKSKSVSVI